jgi:DNA end-binding protein Ku
MTGTATDRSRAAPAAAQPALARPVIAQRPLSAGSGSDLRRDARSRGRRVRSSKAQLMKRARELDVPGRSKMSKEELARAIARKQD